MCREADAALAVARAQLAEIDGLRDEFHGLRAEAMSSLCAALWTAPGFDPLPVPLHAINVKIAVTTTAWGDAASSPSVSATLGHRHVGGLA
jgi:hypothetical protein